MGQFIKYVFASCLGVLLAGFALFGIMGAVIGGLASSGNQAVKVSSNSILELDFSDPIPEKSNNVQRNDFALETDKVLGLHDMIKAVEAAKEDDKIKGIFLDLSSVSGGMGTKASIREALIDFKESGKFIIAYAKYYTQGSYYIASVADKVYLNPVGDMDFRGFASEVTFFKNMLDKMGVKMQVFYAGKFKGASEPYRRTDLSEENRLQIREYISGLYDIFLTDIAESRGIAKTELSRIADQMAIRSPEDALQYKLVDALGYYDEAVNELRVRLDLEEDDKLKSVNIVDYEKGVKKTNYKIKDRIAVVYAEGGINTGTGNAGTIGDEKYMKLLRKIRKDDKIKAVVLRVNSGGGSALASDNIWREMTRIKEKGKPVVVSMGDVAASGGYYIACMADKIYAEEGTITGSIGVVGAIPSAQELMNDKIGITLDTVRTGKYSAGISLGRDISEDERAVIQEGVSRVYQTFKQRVADGRGMNVEQVEQIAQGRVYTGSRALELGLVDEIGGLGDALETAAELAELEEYRTKEYPFIKEPIQELMDQLTGKKDAQIEGLLQKELHDFYPYYQEIKNIKDFKGIQARMPFVIKVTE